jgi:hypothetical protein
MSDLISYKYKGALALVLLHEKHLKLFAETWVEAKKLGVLLPATDDPYYASLESLLFHVLNSAGGYMKWICKQLNLPDPGIDTPPPKEIVENEYPAYINHLVSRWQIPLCAIEEEYFHSTTFLSNWGVPYCIDAMLEHAVMHPIRHEHQLIGLMNTQKQQANK